jgi:predicted nucleotidyltransferase
MAVSTLRCEEPTKKGIIDSWGLNMKMPEIVNVLIEKIKKDYFEDISIVYVYGSYLYSDFHALSDIDLYIVAKTNRGKNLGTTFILNGIGYDFWTVSWEWVERVAMYDERSPSLVTEGKVVYYGSENDLIRFNSLKEKALVVDKEKYKRKAVETMKDVYKTVFLINL